MKIGAKTRLKANQVETLVYSNEDEDLETKLDQQILDAASRLTYDHKGPMGLFPDDADLEPVRDQVQAQ